MRAATALRSAQLGSPRLGSGPLDWTAQDADAVRRAHEVSIAAVGLGLDDLAARLYRKWYASPSGAHQGLDPLGPPLAGVLRQAHAETGRWTQATVARVGAAGVIAVREDGTPGGGARVRAALRGEYVHRPGRPDLGLAPRPGDVVRVLRRAGAVVAEGWWRTWGGGWDPRRLPHEVTRVYLAPDLPRLPALVRAVTGLLGGVDTAGRALAGPESVRPWYLKVGVDGPTLARPDAVVAYVPDAGAAATIEAIVGCAGELVRASPGPPLTRGLVPGISWSQDPGDGRSFGESRCALLADALVDVPAGGDPLAAVAAVLRRAGLDPRAPHLRSSDRERSSS